MNQDYEYELDEIIAEVQSGIYDRPITPTPRDVLPGRRKDKNAGTASIISIILGVLVKTFIVVLITACLLVYLVYGAVYILVKGPSPAARDLCVNSLLETSALKFIPRLFFTEEEIALISGTDDVEELVETDPIEGFPPPVSTLEPGGKDNTGPQPDAWGLIDDDGDGIIIQNVSGPGYTGYMMVVLDPSRVIMGSKPSSYGYRGYTVAEMVAEFDAVAGINAGGFDDPNGQGNGSVPDTMVVYDGKVYFESSGIRTGFVGLDSNHVMHVSNMITAADIAQKDIQYGVCFGPVLVANGVPVEQAVSGVNPRTAIGQRSDGAILMLVIDGRQVISMGATMDDIVEIMLEYGAINACNLDGGSSSLMWYGGDYVNNCASVIGIRPVPTTFLVLKEGVTDHG